MNVSQATTESFLYDFATSPAKLQKRNQRATTLVTSALDQASWMDSKNLSKEVMDYISPVHTRNPIEGRYLYYISLDVDYICSYNLIAFAKHQEEALNVLLDHIDESLYSQLEDLKRRGKVDLQIECPRRGAPVFSYAPILLWKAVDPYRGETQIEYAYRSKRHEVVRVKHNVK